MLTSILLFLGSPSIAADAATSLELHAQADRLQARGGAGLGLGVLGFGAGVALISVNRPAGALNTEPALTREARTMGGIGLLFLGTTSLLWGANNLDKAARIRRQARVQLAPEPVAGVGGGLRLHATF